MSNPGSRPRRSALGPAQDYDPARLARRVRPASADTFLRQLNCDAMKSQAVRRDSAKVSKSSSWEEQWP